MRKVFLFIIALSVLSSCSDSKAKKENNTEIPQEQKLEVVQDNIVKTLDYKKFLKNVWDIEKYPDSFAYKGNIPCIIDFYADWCGPCRKVAPIMEELAKEYEGKIIVYKVNTDNERKLATIFKISSIPTVFFLPTNAQPLSQVGALSKEEYISIINKYLIN